jgi:hypothetical protein
VPLVDVLRLDSRPDRVLPVIDGSRPLEWSAPAPERFNVELDAESAGLIIISQLDDPEWEARLNGPGGERVVAVARLFDNGTAGWQGVVVPGPGRWSLDMAYRGRAAYVGLAASALAWTCWIVAYWRLKRRGQDGDAAP